MLYKIGHSIFPSKENIISPNSGFGFCFGFNILLLENESKESEAPFDDAAGDARQLISTPPPVWRTQKGKIKNMVTVFFLRVLWFSYFIVAKLRFLLD